ncbi:Rho termination factor N-terminal domain-containing protein [Fusobacteria bacterium ZRK30]|nr:Rho termination factor N-terminal domain-containing protein [Fusobacteria bacterium ZRK30]
MKKCKVKLTAIEYKGKIYKPGKIIELDDKDAADLIKSDFVTEIKSRFQEDKTPEESPREKRIKELDDLTIPELKEMAVEMELQLEVTRKAEIIEAIMEAEDEL